MTKLKIDNYKKNHFSDVGFTLVELLVVMIIIGILTTLGVISYSEIMASARNTQRKSDLIKMKQALATYYAEKGAYPISTGRGCASDYCGMCSTYNASGTMTVTGATGYIPNLAPNYIDILPRDPREGILSQACTAGQHCYIYWSNGAIYYLLAHCTPEGTWDSSDPFYDPTRPNHAWRVTN